MKRKVIAAGALLALTSLVAACGGGTNSGGSDDTANTLTVGTIPISDLQQFFVAQDKGYFDDEGLKVKTTSGAGGAELIPALQSGAIDIAWGSVVNVIHANANGIDLQFVSGGAFHGPGHWGDQYAVSPKSGITSASDVPGKRVAVNTLGSMASVTLAKWLDEKAGADAKTVSTVEIPFPDMVGALEQNKVDMAQLVSPFISLAKQKGLKIIDPKLDKVWGNHVAIAGFFTLRSWAKDHPTELAKFQKAIAKATRDIKKSNYKLSRTTLPKYTEIKAATAKKIILSSVDTQIRAQDIQTLIDGLKKYGEIDKDATVDASAMATN